MRNRILAGLGVTALLAAGCAPQQSQGSYTPSAPGSRVGTSTTVTNSGPSVAEVATYQGPRARIAVSTFECKAAKCGRDIGDGLSDMLTTALFQSNRFIVLESQSSLGAVLDELDFAQSGYVEEGKGPETGLMEGADIIITGSIVAFEPDASGGRGGLGADLNLPIVGGIRVENQEAYLAADIRLIDVRTRRIVNATRVEGRASNVGVGTTGGVAFRGIRLTGSLGQYQNTPMEQAIMVMIGDAVGSIASLTPESYYRYSPATQSPGY